MTDTKEKILLTALRLFARDGYEAVSVSAIAGELGMTKGALYKHYKNKRAIFETIIERMYQSDYERAQENEVPAETFDQKPAAFRALSVDKIIAFAESHFDYMTGDDFGSGLRRLLTLEHYRNAEIAQLYHNYFTSGPVAYLEDIFRRMITEGTLKKADPRLLALEFYAPLYLLISMSDAAADKTACKQYLQAFFGTFIRQNMAEPQATA